MNDMNNAHTITTKAGDTYEIVSLTDVTETASRSNVPASTEAGRILWVSYRTAKRSIQRYVKLTDTLR